MKLFSVFQTEKYKGSDLLVIYSSRQECMDYIQNLEFYKKGWYEYSIVEFEMGQEIEKYGKFERVDPYVV